MVDTGLLRFILSRYLYKEDVQDLLEELGLPVTGSKPELVNRLARSPEFDPSEALSFLRKEELADLCEEFGLPVSGSRPELVSRVEEALNV
ncbi:MAG: hypothetical protein L3K16_08515 [Thermoplasmata archaeon]|nr:hypothetical protein [Thermoplasmata archaeon]